MIPKAQRFEKSVPTERRVTLKQQDLEELSCLVREAREAIASILQGRAKA